jgi:hypothetical protein
MLRISVTTEAFVAIIATLPPESWGKGPSSIRRGTRKPRQGEAGLVTCRGLVLDKRIGRGSAHPRFANLLSTKARPLS